MLVEIIKSGKSSLSDATKPNYIKNVLKPMTWDTSDRRNIEGFLTEYEIYCDTSDYDGDDVMVKKFGSFLKVGAFIAFTSWQGVNPKMHSHAFLSLNYNKKLN